MSLFPIANRSVLMARPQQPFVDWLHRVAEEFGDEEMADVTLEDVQEDITVFLIDPVDEGDPEPAIALDWEDIMEENLVAWVEDEELWPEFTRKLFDEFFKIEVHSIALDTGLEDIASEEPEEED